MTFALLNSHLTNDVMRDVIIERSAQDQEWGLQRHPFTTWAAILAEETGEVGKAALTVELDHITSAKDALHDLRTEAIQAAAVAVAIAEHATEAIEREG